MTNLNRIKIFIKFWLWGAMHSPHFHLFTIQLNPFPIEIKIRGSEWSCELFVISIAFYMPYLSIKAPYAAEVAFINAMKNEGMEFSLDFLDSIPF